MKDVAPRLVSLGRALRAHGVATSVRDELDAADALALLDLADREEVKAALRIALRIPRAAFAAFERLFPVFWESAPAPEIVAPRHGRHASSPRARGALHWDPDTRHLVVTPEVQAEGEHPGYSPEAVLRRKPFEHVWSDRDVVAMERLLARLARRLATRRSRRLVPTRGRGRADMRSSHRRALRTAGEYVSLARRARAIERPRLVFLLDTSGSMDVHARFLMSFLLALRRAAPGAEVFAFNTALVCLTRSLVPGKLRLTLDRLAASVPDWHGGTRIGACLDALVRRHSGCLDPRTLLVILSDGLDRGEPELLEAALRTLRARVRKLIWLNPLMGDARFEPTALGMQAALPFVDHLASAHDYASLERLLPQLAS